jgi:hypothetical protein
MQLNWAIAEVESTTEGLDHELPLKNRMLELDAVGLSDAIQNVPRFTVPATSSGQLTDSIGFVSLD